MHPGTPNPRFRFENCTLALQRVSMGSRSGSSNAELSSMVRQDCATTLFAWIKIESV